MCAPGPIGTLFGIEDPATNPDVPNPSNVGADYLSLIGGFAKGLPTVYGAEAQYKPLFTKLGLQSTNQSLFGSGNMPGLLKDFGSTVNSLGQTTASANTLARGANVGDVGALGAAAAGAVRSVNPGQSALIDQL